MYQIINNTIVGNYVQQTDYFIYGFTAVPYKLCLLNVTFISESWNHANECTVWVKFWNNDKELVNFDR